MFPADLASGKEPASTRLLDPVVMAGVPAGHNLTVSPEVRGVFGAAWGSVNATRDSRARLESAWAELEPRVFNELAIEPLFHGACGSESCVGVSVAALACVCPPQA